MLKVNKLWALLYKDAFKSTRLIALIVLGISVLAPLWNLYSIGYASNNFYTAIASETGMLAIVSLMIIFFVSIQRIYRVWISNKFRMLPVYTHQLYFSTVTAIPVGVFSTIGVVALLNGIACFFSTKYVLTKSNVNYSDFKFDGHALLTVLVNMTDIIISSVISVTFILILVEVVRQIVKKKYQKFVQVLAFLLFFWLLTIGVDNISDLLRITSSNAMNLTRLVFDIVLVALEMLVSVLLIDKKISTIR